MGLIFGDIRMKKLSMKKCIICGKEFLPNSGSQKCCCVECTKIKNKLYSKKYQETHKDFVKKIHRDYYYKNYIYKKFSPIKCKVCGKIFIPKYHNEKCCSDECKRINTNNIKYNYHVRQTSQNKNYKIKIFCRSQIKRCLLSKKEKHTFDILWYTPEQLISRLEFQFKKDMTWDNYGTLWNIDHRKPLSKFNFFNLDGSPNYKQICIANSLANLKPLYVKENCSKGDKNELDINIK